MKQTLKIFLLLLLPFFAKAQTNQNRADSLKQALRIATADSSKIRIAFSLIGFYAESNRDSALSYIQKALLIAEKNNKSITVANLLSRKGYQLSKLGRYGESLKCFLRGVKILEDPANEKKTFFQGTPSELRKRRLTILAELHMLWGILMAGTNDIAQQKYHYQKSMKIAEENGNDAQMATINMNFGSLYSDLGKLDSALNFEQTALAIMQKEGNRKTYIVSVYRNIGEIYQKKGDKEQAVYNWHQGISWSGIENNQSSLAGLYGKLASFYIDEKNRDSSLYYAKKQLAVLRMIESPNPKEAYSHLYMSYELNGNKDSAYLYKGFALEATEKALKERIENLGDFQKEAFKEQERLQLLEQEKIETKNKLRTYVLFSMLGVFLIIGFFLYRNNQQKQKANQVLQEQKDKVESTLSQLKSTQAQLIQSEKLASLGELTAGIAHEIQNPLNFVNNFSELSVELIEELKEEAEKSEIDKELIIELASDLSLNQEKINLHGKRASSIVKGMLEHSRQSTGERELTDINQLADEYLRLAYHGLRAKDNSFNSDFELIPDENLPKIEVIPQDIGRVLLNLINNAFWAVNQRAQLSKSLNRTGGPASESYTPSVFVSTKQFDNQIIIKVTDNGTGMSDEVKAKIFQPFFTTKPTGQGTGLGLSLAYDIITKGHGGTIDVESLEGEGTTFIVKLPI